jgi:hypothetical protein
MACLGDQFFPTLFIFIFFCEFMFGLQVATQFNPIGYPTQIFFNPNIFAKKKKTITTQT